MSDASLPEGLRMRPATLADVKQVVCLANSNEIEYLGEPDTSVDFLRHVWSLSSHKPEESARVVVTENDEIIASVDTRHKRHMKIDMELEVHPAYRGQVELTLMRWVEERAQSISRWHLRMRRSCLAPGRIKGICSASNSGKARALNWCAISGT